MERRKFVQSLLVTPATLAAQQTPPPQPSSPPPAAAARSFSQGLTEIPFLQLTEVDITAATTQRYFTATQFAVLEKLGNILVPPLNGHPGALDAHAPEFLDFLIGVSPADRQELYRHGLDSLDAQAHKHFHKPFSELETKQADEIIRPLLVARPWPQELPSDGMKAFMAQVHDDLRTATANSREWAATAASSGRRSRRFGGSTGYFWKPVDPVVTG